MGDKQNDKEISYTSLDLTKNKSLSAFAHYIFLYLWYDLVENFDIGDILITDKKTRVSGYACFLYF